MESLEIVQDLAKEKVATIGGMQKKIYQVNRKYAVLTS